MTTQRQELDRLNAMLKTKRGKIQAAMDRIETKIKELLTGDNPLISMCLACYYCFPPADKCPHCKGTDISTSRLNDDEEAK